MRYVQFQHIQKIKEKERLVFSNTLVAEVVSEYFVLILLAGTPLFISLLILISNLNKDEDVGTMILLCILAFAFFVLLLYARIQATKLVRISGINRKTNKRIINGFATQFGWDIDQDHPEMTKLHKSLSLSNWGKDIFIFFDKNDLLVCSLRYGKNQSISPFHWFANRSSENHIKRVMSEALTKSNQTLTNS